jgi:ribosomal protein S27AE
MNKNNKCNCPLCGGDFIPETGLTPKEHLTRGILKTYCEMQKSTHTENLPCPRCGYMSMKPRLATNALSRHFNIYICSTCGTDEALRDFKKDVLPLSAWNAVIGLLIHMPGIECPKHIPDQNSQYPLCINRKCEKSSTCGISVFMAEQDD